MKARIGILLLGIAALAASLSPPSHAQTSMRTPTPEFLATLKAGQWIQLEGLPQPGGPTVLCTELKVLTGDFLDDDWELRGLVRNVDPRVKEFYVSRYHVRLRPTDVEYDDPTGRFKSFADVKAGCLVKLEGTYMKDGSFLAKEVNDESDKLPKKPGIEKKIQVVGKIESVSPSRRTVTALGSTFVVNDKTKLKSVIK